MHPPTPQPIARWRTRLLWQLPPLLIGLRFVLGPLLWLDAADGAPTPWFLAGFSLAMLTDIFDGIIARRTGRVTARLREADGWTDVWFYAWIAASAWQSHRATVLALAWPLLTTLAAQVLAWGVDVAKYRRVSNYHTYLGKAWGLTLMLAVAALFGFNTGGVFLRLAVIVGIVHARRLAGRRAPDKPASLPAAKG